MLETRVRTSLMAWAFLSVLLYCLVEEPNLFMGFTHVRAKFTV